MVNITDKINKARLADIKVFMAGLVRDKNGKPRVDGDPRDLHASILAAMTEQEVETSIKEWEEANGKTG